LGNERSPGLWRVQWLKLRDSAFNRGVVGSFAPFWAGGTADGGLAAK